MLDRQKVETILSRRFPGAGFPQIAAAANAIMGLSDEWEEVGPDELGHAGAGIGVQAREAEGAEFRLLRRRAVIDEA